MKVKVSNLLVSLAVVFLAAPAAHAQDELPLHENQFPAPREFNLDEDKILIYDQPGHSAALKDSIQQTQKTVQGNQVKTSKHDAKNVHKDKEHEDALSFNFLYYMIQKFKMSDLVDQN
jgi:hypothetical protein